MAFAEIGVEVEFVGKNEAEKGVIIDKDDQRLKELGISVEHIKLGQTVVKVDPAYFRPTEVELLIGDPVKAKTKLGWEPKFTLPMLVKDMVQSDLQLMRKEEYLKKGGFNIVNYFE